MPRSLVWTMELDDKLEHLIDFQGATIRCAAKQLGVSRSFAQRRGEIAFRAVAAAQLLGSAGSCW